jgi:hypothetical protein
MDLPALYLPRRFASRFAADSAILEKSLNFPEKRIDGWFLRA